MPLPFLSGMLRGGGLLGPVGDFLGAILGFPQQQQAMDPTILLIGGGVLLLLVLKR